MRRRLARTALALLLASSAAPTARAASDPSGIDRPPGLWIENVRDASILWGRGSYFALRGGYDRIRLPVEGHPVSDLQESAHGRVFLGYGLLGGAIDLAASFDVRGSRFTPEDSPGRTPPASASYGDVGDSRLALRFALPSPGDRLAASIEAFAFLPTGNPDKGFSADAADGGALLGLSAHWPAVRAHLQAGYRVNRNEEDGALLYPLFYPKLAPGEDDTNNDALILRAAVEFSGGRVDLFAEILADRLPRSGVVSARENVLEVAPGARILLRRGLYLTGGAGFNLSRDDPATTALPPPEVLFPDWRLFFGVHWTGVIGGTDRDDDGIADDLDRCPDSREDYDGHQDDDGCPDPDNDGDGILDDWDKAPNDAEDMDGFEDEDGAPEYDNDEDGLPDAEDFCPDDPEDLDGDRDDDGCPDPEPPGAGAQGAESQG